jgi:hypothetical protein
VGAGQWARPGGRRAQTVGIGTAKGTKSGEPRCGGGWTTGTHKGKSLELRRAQTLQGARISRSGGEWEMPVLGFLVVFLTGASCLFFLIYSLCQPKVYPNPGVSAYLPPPATRLIPLQRRSDAPELADLAAQPVSALADLTAQPVSALTALAKAQTSDPSAKREIRPPSRRHPRADPRANDQRRFESTQQWNGYHDWNNSRTWSGGPKSWF